MPNYPKYKISFRKGEVFGAIIKDRYADGLVDVEVTNTSLKAYIEGDIKKNDRLYLIVLNEKPLQLTPHSVLIQKRANDALGEEELEKIKRILNLQNLEYADVIVRQTSLVSKRIVKYICYEINKVLVDTEETDIEEAIYILNLMGDSKIPITSKSYQTVKILFQSQNTTLTNIIKAYEYLVDNNLVDERIAKGEDKKYNTTLQYMLDYHSKEGLYNLLISKGLIGKRFQNALSYFDGLLFWNSIATVNNSPLIIPIILSDPNSVYGIRLMHIWFTKLKSKSSFLLNDIFRLRADLEGDDMKLTYDKSDLNLDIEKLAVKMDEQGYRLQGYNTDKTLIFLDRNKNLSPISSDTTFVI